MYPKKIFIFIAQSIFLLNLWVAVGSSQDLNLPDIGNPADAVLSKSDEAQIGSSIMRQIRSIGTVMEDQQITE